MRDLSSLEQFDTRSTLNQQAYQNISEAIASLEFKPGAAVSENGLAEQLGMSRSPIRQALKQLEHEGLVVTLPQRGTVITKLHEQESRDAVVMRKLLESWAVTEMEAHSKQPDLQHLTKLLDFQAEAIAEGEYMRFLQLDDQFHACIIAGAQNSKAVSLFQQVNKSILRVRAWTLRYFKTLGAGVQEHKAIFSAISQPDWVQVRTLLIGADDELLRAIGEMKRTEPSLFS